MAAPHPTDGWFVASCSEAAECGPGPCILSPVTAGLDPHLAVMACVLPIGDINGALLRALEESRPPPGVIAGVLAHDPFQRPRDLMNALRDAGVSGLCNWPSVGVLNGELASALDHSGCTWAQELALLAQGREQGFGVCPVVHTEAQLTQALELEPDLLLITPGLSTPDPDERRQRAAATVALATAAREESGAGVYVHEHPGFGDMLRNQLPAGVGAIRHRP